MTTIACDGKTMAADSRTIARDTIIDDAATKIGRSKAGWIVGVSGLAGGLEAAIAAIDAGKPPEVKESTVLCLLPDGTGRQYREDGLCSVVVWPAAIGSGRDHALTAMDLGFDAPKAIEAAKLRDPFSGGPMVFMR